MRLATAAKFKFKESRGFTITEMIVSVALSALVMLAMMKEYGNSLRFAKDEEIKSAAMVRAQAVLEAIGAELRVLGNGVPYDQSNFQIGETTLSDPTVSRPINVDTATASYLQFRLNETGDVYLLTANFDPGSTLTFSLTSVDGLVAGDPIYLSNSVVGEDDGLYGIIESVNTASKTVTLQAGPVYSI
ncbi:MAG: prepilin-type N-terminal cleavage/methylation domain-containing protein [Deltaproteobacteria bacterium]|nr:prepilin-type N-terminal cleavage/methylation domain-containing protein [Deltaproteobacteria bacterium]